MAAPPSYPPYQQPILDRVTGQVTTPWHRFFLSLVGGAGGIDGGAITDGTVPLDAIEVLGPPRLLGRGSSGTGPVEELTLGTGLALTGTVLSVTTGGSGIETVGYWTPISNGNPLAFELLYTSDTGDCIVGFVPTP